jgi:hypothetical protein
MLAMKHDDADITFGEVDFETIEAAVMETARGRWFLREYARRNRNADTQAVLEAVARLREEVLANRPMGSLRADLEEMAAAIRATKSEIRSFPALDDNDPLSTLPDEEFQAVAEQRIRRMVQTLHYLEGRISVLAARCGGGAAEQHPGAAPFEGENSAHPHPAFLM